MRSLLIMLLVCAAPALADPGVEVLRALPGGVHGLRLPGDAVFADRYREGKVELAGCLKSNQLTYREHVTDGFENTPQAFIGMLTGENVGKALVRVAAE